MDITRLSDGLRQDLARAAELGDEPVRQAASQLAYALEPSLRLALMEALTEAAAELTQAMPEGAAIEVRLHGRDPHLVLNGDLSAAAPQSGASGAGEPDADDGEATARITLRLSESLKQRAEHLAARSGQSLNTWLVHAARAAADHDAHRSDKSGRRPHRPDRHIRGWVK
jgi:hypothetical protein